MPRLTTYRCRDFEPGRVPAPLLVIAILCFAGCKANQPGSFEGKIAQETKEIAIGGKDWKNPTPDDSKSQKEGAEHFQHHCSICHGLDGQNTGVPFADKMSPPVANLAGKPVQDYSDGQLKWIMENGIRFSGMPRWKGILSDEEMWHIVHFVRHLPPQASLGIPKIYKEEAHEHEAAAEAAERPAHAAGHAHKK